MAWTYNDIISDLNTLIAMFQHQKNQDIKRNILRTIIGVKDQIMPDNKNTSDKIDNIFENIFKYREIYPVLERCYNLFNKTGFNSGHFILKDKSNDIRLEEAYELLHEFYKSCGKVIFNYYSILEKQRDNCLNLSQIDSNYKGFIIPISILDKVYINISLNDRWIKDNLSTFVHEYGHAIISLMNKDRYYNNNNFLEIESFFFELIGLDFFYHETNDKFYENHIYNLSLAESIIIDSVLSRKYAAEEAMFTDSDYENIKNICEKEIHENDSNFNKCHTFFSNDVRYSYSFLCAVELFELYKQDKELAINTLINIATKNANMVEEELEIINGHITPVKSMSKHLNRVKHITE